MEAMYLMLQQERFSFRKRKAQALPTRSVCLYLTVGCRQRREAIAKQTLRYRQRMTIKVAMGESYQLALLIEMAFGVGGVGLAGVCGPVTRGCVDRRIWQ